MRFVLFLAITLSACVHRPTASPVPSFDKLKATNSAISASNNKALSDGKDIRAFLRVRRDFSNLDRIDAKSRMLLEGESE